MDYIKPNILLQIAFSVLIVNRSCHALLDRSLEENFPDHLLPPHLNPEDDNHTATSCDFETPCAWTLSNHSVRSDWRVKSPRQQRPSSQVALRPVSDHSEDSSDGHFLLLSPSSAAEASGTCEYHLTSPVMLGSGPLCYLYLARYWSGPRVGNLSVLVRPAHSASVIFSSGLRSRRYDGGREQWEELEAEIGLMEEPFQVTLLYHSCLGSEEANMALDSLELRDCEVGPHDLDLDVDCHETSFHCDEGGCIDRQYVCDFHNDCPLGEDEGFICDALPLGARCSFEAGTCGWPVTNKLSSWRRVTGRELTYSDDILGTTLHNSPGHFLLFQVRENSSQLDAFIQSSSFPRPVSSDYCQFHFSLYLYGDFNGTLLVVVIDNDTATWSLLWERSGGWEDKWEDVTLQLPALHHGFYIKMGARWESGSQADIALDNITLGAACFHKDLNSLLLGHKFFHDFDLMGDPDFFGPLPEPSASEMSLMTWLFTSCGASGPRGPTQAQCDSAYRKTNVSVTLGKDGPLKGVQMWRVPATNRYMISAYGAAGGKGAKNHNKRSHGVFISAIFPLEKGDILYILVGHQGEDACPGRNPLTQKICLEESSVIEEGHSGDGSGWAGGGGGGGGATYIFKMESGVLVPLLIAAGGGGKAYMEDPDSSLDQIPLEQYENDTSASSTNGRTGAAGGGGGLKDTSSYVWAGKSLTEGAEGGSPCPQALAKLEWATFGGFGGGGGPCTAGGGGGGYRGGDAALTDDITADGQDGISFVHPLGEIFLQPLAAMESHGECEIKVQLNCSHCQSQSCKRDDDTRLILCLCHNEEVLASDNVTCTAASQGPAPEGQLSLSLILAVVASTVVTGIVLTCASLTLSKRLFQLCVNSVPSTFHRL